MKKFIAVLAAALFLALPAFAAAGTAGEITVVENEDGTKTMTVRPIEETFTKEQDPGTPQFTTDWNNILNIRSRADKTRSIFLKFDIKDLGAAKIQKVELQMTNSQWKQEPPEGANTGGDESYVIVKIDPSSWKQEELAFQNSPLFDEATDKIGERVQEGSMGFMERTIDEISPDFIKGNGLYSLALIPTTGEDDSQWFSSRDPDFGAEQGPALVITYTDGAAGMTLYIILGVVALLVVAGVIFLVAKKKKA